MLVNHTASISPTRQHKRKKACLFTANFEYSDQWAAYNRVGNIVGLEHHTVNHTLHFVDPVTGVHTQNIESYWNRCKTKIKSMKGVRRDMLPGYLDEFMWRERAGADKFDAILNEIALQYPVNR